MRKAFAAWRREFGVALLMATVMLTDLVGIVPVPNPFLPYVLFINLPLAAVSVVLTVWPRPTPDKNRISNPPQIR